MRKYMSIEEQVDADFARARHSVFLRRMGARLRGDPSSTFQLSFEDVRKCYASSTQLRDSSTRE